MIREYKTAMAKNRRIKIGDKVIFVPFADGQTAFHGTVTNIYRIGDSKMFIDVETKTGKKTRIFAKYFYGAEIA